MGRVKPEKRRPSKEDKDERRAALVEAIKAKRQECLDALDKVLPVASLRATKALSELEAPSHPALPLAEASKLAATCALYLHLKTIGNRRPSGYMPQLIVAFFRLAADTAMAGLADHKSGMCAWLWATVGFLVEDQRYRSIFDLNNNERVVKQLSDPREDEIDDAPMPPGCRSPSGEEVPRQRDGRDHVRALSRLEDRLRQSEPLGDALSKREQLQAVVERLIQYQVVNDLPLNAALLGEVRKRMEVHLQMQALQKQYEQQNAINEVVLSKQMDPKIGKFRTLRDEQAKRALVILEQPMDEGEFQGKPVADFRPPASLFFERQLEDAITKQGRLPTPKERAANENAKTVMDYWSTTTEPMTHELLAKVLSIPVDAVRAHLTQELKESQEKGGKVALQSDTQLKLLALGDWLSSGERGFAEMDCRGGTYSPSFLSAAPAFLTQLESEDPLQQASLEHDYRRVIEGEGLLWEGDVPCRAILLTEVQLVRALQQRRFAEPDGPDKPGALHLIRALFKGAASDGADNGAEELDRMAKLPAADLDTLEDAVERGKLSRAMRETLGPLECLAPGVETLRHGGLGLQSHVPPYDAHSMELLAEKAVERERRPPMTGQVLRIMRPMLADLRPAAMSDLWRPTSLKTIPKMELILHGNEGMVGAEMMPLVSLCRGRLILALQYTLWRLEAWLHKPSWTVTPKTTPVPQMIKDSLNELHEALCMGDDALIQYCPILQVNVALKDPDSGAPLGAPIDEGFASRYRFSAAGNKPGTAHGVKGMPYLLNMVELNGLMDSGSVGTSESKDKEECHAKTGGCCAGAESDECTGYRANPACPVPENSCCACQPCWHNRRWLGDGPSPMQYPEQEPFAQRVAAENAELIEEIFDILETLKVSKLLSTDILRCVAGYIIIGLRATHFSPGANLLQLTWEHMAVLTAQHLEHLRDNLLRVLGEHWHLTFAYAEAKKYFSGPVMVAFKLSPDKSAFIAAHLPVRHEVLQAEADITERHALASRNLCCNTSDEGAEDELPAVLPAPPPNPPKQARTKGRPEGHQHDSAAHGSGRPSPQVADLDAMIQDVAEEMIAVGNDAPSIFKFYVEMLYGAGNRAIAMPPRVTYTQRAQACEAFQRQMLRAAVCGRLIFGAIDHRNKLSRALQAGVLAFLARIKCPALIDDIVDTWASCQSSCERDTSAAEEAIRPLFTAMLEIFEDMQTSASRLWSLAIEEVDRQVQVVGLHATAVEELCLNLNICDMPGARIAMLRSEFACNKGAWMEHEDQVMSDLAEFRERAAQPVQIPTVESMYSEERVMRGLDELRKTYEASQHQLYEAIQVGVLALTSLEHRISALRAALLSIIRRVELGSRLWHTDVLQSSILAALSDRLVDVAKIQMEEQRQKAAKALLESEEQSEKQKADAAAKKAAKKERAQKQKAEAAAQAAAAAKAKAAKLAEQRAEEEAEEAARAQEAAEAAGLEVPVMAEAEGPSLHSHSLAGEACSHEEWEDVDAEVGGGGAEGRSLSRDRAKSEHSPERGHEDTEQHENSAAGARRKKKKSGCERNRAARAAVAAQAQEQKSGSAENAPPDGWPSQEQEDESEWQEAKPKRSQHRMEHQEQMDDLNGHMENGMAHDRAPTASQRADPVWASVNRAKPDTSRTQCMHCGGTTHKMSDCPELRNLGTMEKREVCIAIMDGFRERVNRILRSATARPYAGCQICDGLHQLQMCPHLDGMTPAQKADVFSAYRRNKILEKDALLRKWLETRDRRSKRATPAASPLKGMACKPAFATSTYPTPQQSPPHSANGAPRPQAPGQGPPQQGPRGTAGPARHESIHSFRHQRTGQRGYSAAAPAAPDAGAQPQPRAGASWPREQSGQVHAGDWPPPPPGRSPQVQQQSGHSSASGQSSGWGQSGTALPDSLNDDATSGMPPHASPARPRPRERPHPAAEGSPPEAHMDPYAGFGEQWEAGSSEDEQTTYHPANCLQAAEPVMGVPAGALRPDEDFANLMSMLHPKPTDKPAPSGPVGWSKVVADDAADLGAGPTPAEAKKSSAAAAQARQEDDDMQAAIQASLDQSKPTPCQLPKYAHASAQQVLRGAVAAPRLQNMIGEYNCFLNVVVQCLWHCRHFKCLFSSLAIEHPAIIQSNDVVAGLADLFSEFDDQERQAGKQQGMRERKVVAPTKLRDALHALNPERFSVGEMSDAAEVLGTIYEQMGALEGIGARLTQVFELPVRLAVHCGACGKDTHQSAFVQSFYCVSATALRMQGMLALDDNEGAMPPLGVLLQGIDAQDHKSCDTDEGGCGTLNPVQCFLEGMPPPMFTLQLAWESHNESTEAISEVMDAVQEEVDIGHIYKALGSKEYRLHSMVCYYGEHYHAFVHTEGRWVAFDDATINLVGAWENVIEKCIKGRIQPSLLFYEEPPGGKRLGG